MLQKGHGNIQFLSLVELAPLPTKVFSADCCLSVSFKRHTRHNTWYQRHLKAILLTVSDLRGFLLVFGILRLILEARGVFVSLGFLKFRLYLALLKYQYFTFVYSVSFWIFSFHEFSYRVWQWHGHLHLCCGYIVSPKQSLTQFGNETTRPPHGY